MRLQLTLQKFNNIYAWTIIVVLSTSGAACKSGNHLFQNCFPISYAYFNLYVFVVQILNVVNIQLENLTRQENQLVQMEGFKINLCASHFLVAMKLLEKLQEFIMKQTLCGIQLFIQVYRYSHAQISMRRLKVLGSNMQIFRTFY